jgi:hypothetical protein
VCDGLGNPLAVLLTPGQQHEGTVCAELLASVRGYAPAREAVDHAAALSWWWRIEAMMRVPSEDTCAVVVYAV